MKYKYIDEGKQHLHTLDEKPLIGTSSVSNVLAKPLTWWASGLAVAKFGWINKKDENGKYRTKEERLAVASNRFSEIKELDSEEYLDLVDSAYSAHAEKLDSSASAGTDLHAEIERYIKWVMGGSKGDSIFDTRIEPFIIWANKNVKRFLWSEIHCFSKELWVGGISDFGYEDMEGKYVVGDIKSSKEAYLSQFWQCAGYAIQLEENGGFDRDGNKILTLDKPIEYFMIFPFGMKEPEAQINLDNQGGRDAFKAELFLYKKLNS